MNPVDIGTIVCNVNYLDWRFDWEPMGDGVLVWANFLSYEAPDAITSEEHEAREWFHYKGKQVYSPHTSVMEKVNG